MYLIEIFLLVLIGSHMKHKCFIAIMLMFGFVGSAMSDTVSSAQRMLNYLGYQAGPVDGSYGSKTNNAITKLYEDNGLKFDGSLDENDLFLMKRLLSSNNRQMPEVHAGKKEKILGKKKNLPLLKALITKQVDAQDLSDYELCTSLLYMDLVDTYNEMKIRKLDCLFSSKKQTSWKPTSRRVAFQYLKKYQEKYDISIPQYDLNLRKKPFGRAVETSDLYHVFDSRFSAKLLERTSDKQRDFCYDWFSKISYIPEDSSKNVDGSQSWLPNSLMDGFVICSSSFNISYLAALFSKKDLDGIKNTFDTWVLNDAPRKDVETNKNAFAYILAINKAFAALEMLNEEFDWSTEFRLNLESWIKRRALELFPSDLAGKHVTSFCKHEINNLKDMNEACKNGGILRAQALLRAGILTNDIQFIEMSYVAFHRFMSGVREDGSIAGDSVRGCVAADYNIWATQFMSDFHELWMQIGEPLWNFKVQNSGSVEDAIRYSVTLRDDFEKINKYTLDDQWNSCGEMKEKKIQQASLRGKEYYPLESFGSYFFLFKPEAAIKFFDSSERKFDAFRYTSQSGSNYHISYLKNNPEKFKEQLMNWDLEKERRELEKERRELEKELFEPISIDVRKVIALETRGGDRYEEIRFQLLDLSVGKNKYEQFNFSLMIDGFSRDQDGALYDLLRLQVSSGGLLDSSTIEDLKNCSQTYWKKTPVELYLMYVIDEMEGNQCILRLLNQDKQNILPSLAANLPEILEMGFILNPEKKDRYKAVFAEAIKKN
jgi:peptidoglycan hydrolase-like protein with peptidoglycan-binding domain